MIDWGYFAAGALGAIVGSTANHLIWARHKLLWVGITKTHMDMLIAEHDCVVRGLCERLRDTEHDLDAAKAELVALKEPPLRGATDADQQDALTPVHRSVIEGTFGVRSMPKGGPDD